MEEPLQPFHSQRHRLDGIGSTEMLHIFCSNTAKDCPPGSSGKPVPGDELKLLDDDGKPVGELDHLRLGSGAPQAAHHRPDRHGQSWLVCAFGHQACRQGLSVRDERTPRLLTACASRAAGGSYSRKVALLARTDLLILDDFGLKPLP
ncbi:MAG TPA: ATP-binding protein [Blastocatellia bacterium]